MKNYLMVTLSVPAVAKMYYDTNQDEIASVSKAIIELKEPTELVTLLNEASLDHLLDMGIVFENAYKDTIGYSTIDDVVTVMSINVAAAVPVEVGVVKTLAVTAILEYCLELEAISDTAFDNINAALNVYRNLIGDFTLNQIEEANNFFSYSVLDQTENQ